MASNNLREELECSICLNSYTDPVMLRCGHNFCQLCIESALNTQEGVEVYTCPECRAEFQERPALERNRKLCNIVDRFLSAQAEQEGPGICCAYCVHSPVPAIKTCLQCEVSFCDTHLKAHNKLVEHVLNEPTTSLMSHKCTIHSEILKYYCTEDEVCVCVSCCLAGEHKSHQVELLHEASENKKEKLRKILETITSKNENTEKKIQSLQKQDKEMQDKAAGETERITALFKEIREQLETLKMQVLAEIINQEKKGLLQISEMIQKLQKYKDKLYDMMSHIEELCNMTDPITVLKGYSDKDLQHSQSDEDNGMHVVASLDEILTTLMLVNGFLQFDDMVLDPKTKERLNKLEISDILLDVKTANNYIVVSDSLKSATYSSTVQQRPDEQERFKSRQVFSTCSFSSGQHYWEVDLSEAKQWIIGVAYPSIERKISGNESFIGYNSKSWSLAFTTNLSALHNHIWQHCKSQMPVHLIGVYLDYDAGRLSFYDLSDSVTHLHTFTATFNEPLHAAFYIYENCCIQVNRRKYNIHHLIHNN